MTKDGERVAAGETPEEQAPESETTAIVWPADLDGTSTIRMQVLTDVPGTTTTVDTVFDVSDGEGYKYEPFVTPDAHSGGWGVAWLESPEPGTPAQVKLTYVDQLGESAGELTVHEEASASAAVHQHDVVLSSFGSPDPRDPVRMQIDGINVVWISTELGPHDDPSTASPYGRVMFQRYEVSPGTPGSAHYKLEEIEHRLASTANDNQPVELGFGRSPSVTKLADGETAITWIDEQNQIQGVFISDEIENSRLSTRMRSLSPGIEQIRVGSSHAQGIGVAIGNMIALEFLRDTKFASFVAQTLSEKVVEKLDTGPDAPPPGTANPETFGAAHDLYEATLASSVRSPGDDVGSPDLAGQATQLNSAPLAESSGNEPNTVAEDYADIDFAEADWPVSAGSSAGQPVPAAMRDDMPGTAAGARGNPDAGSASQIVRVAIDDSGQTNVFGLAFDAFGQPVVDSSIQLSDGSGIVENATAAIGKTGYLAVWEEKTDDGALADLKGRYYSFGDADRNIAPGLIGEEFSIHAGTSDETEHDAAVSAYTLESADGVLIDAGFQVAYVATDSASPDAEFGAVKVAHIVVDLDSSDGQTPPLSPAGGHPSNGSDLTSAAQSTQIHTLTPHGRDPAIAALSDGDQVVTWVQEDGRIDGAILTARVSEDGDYISSGFEVGALNLSDVLRDEVVAAHQEQQVLALQESSFVLIWVSGDGDDGFDIVGKHFRSTGDGQWAPSDTDVFIHDIRTSKDNERIDFKVWVNAGDDGGFSIAYRIDGDDGIDYRVKTFGDFDDDHSGPGDGESASPALVVVFDTSGDHPFDLMALKQEYAQPAALVDDDGSANSGSTGDGSNVPGSGELDFITDAVSTTLSDQGLPDPHKSEDRSHDIWQT